jgi:hypothetical protein
MSVSIPEMDASKGQADGQQGGGYFPVGRMFVNPLFDYLLIGGVLGFIVIPFLPSTTQLLGFSGDYRLAAMVLFVNSCHFAASTVRLYTKKGMYQRNPFHTLMLPMVSIVIVTVCIASDETLGRNFFYLYLTWSPYHYASQAFGLAAMYGHRSGAKLLPGDSRLLWWTAILPFLYAFLNSDTGGLSWFVSKTWIQTQPWLAALLDSTQSALGIMAFTVPVLLYFQARKGGRPGLPMISFAILFSNGAWWIALPYLSAFGWVTVAHSVQYLAIILIFHVREKQPNGGSTGEIVREVLGFYGKCLVLGYLLFQVLPYAYVALGFPLASSLLVIAAGINVHHFIVDRVIWRQRTDPNMKVVVG